MSTTLPIRTFGVPTSPSFARMYGGPNGYGHQPDPSGHRVSGFNLISDHVSGMLKAQNLTSLPRATNNRRFISRSMGGPGVRNQGRTSSCTGHATISGIMITNAIIGEQKPLPALDVFSEVENYRQSRLIDRSDKTIPLTDTGAEPNQNWRAIGEWGVVTIRQATSGYILDANGDPMYPDPDRINDEPAPIVLERSNGARLKGPYKILSVGTQYTTDVMMSLAAGIVLPTAIEVDNTIERYTGGILGAPDPMDILGGHYVVLIDYEWDGNDPNSIVLYWLSSWGKEWGEAGLARGNVKFLRGTTDTYVAQTTLLAA